MVRTRSEKNDVFSVEHRLRSYQRSAAAVTEQAVLPPHETSARRWRRAGARTNDLVTEQRATAEGDQLLKAYDACIQPLRATLASLAALRRPRLLGKVDQAQHHVSKATSSLEEARLALEAADFGACGQAVLLADRELSAIGSAVTMALDAELNKAAFTREKKAALQANLEERRQSLQVAEEAAQRSPRSALLASTAVYGVMAEGLALAAEILSQQAVAPLPPKLRASDTGVQVVSPHELETFADVGGLEEAKARLRSTIGLMLERSGDAARAGVVHNGVLLYGPPGTGKTLLARAVAGEYGLRFIRFSPALIASAYQHQPAEKLRQMFALAAESAPCLLFLDEVDAIAGRREAVLSPDQRELITQLLNSLEEYRNAPGLIIMAATNTLDQLDPALREGRFDSRIAVPLPDLEARTKILEVQLEHHGDLVERDGLDLPEVAQRTAGRSGAALASIVTGAAGRAMAREELMTQADLLAEIEGRSGQDRAQTVEERITWDDVVLPEATRQKVSEILLVFQNPELGRRLGVRPPAGILLHGPPGTGKTTIAKAMATEVKASFYEQSAADLLSKWVGESEQKVAQLFTRARNNRPSIIFCDEIDAVLKRRSADSSAPWEERVVSQFLRELDGLGSGEGVLLIGATNRPDMIDDAVRERRLVPIEVPLPDADGRIRLLELLLSKVQVGPDVDIAELAAITEGLSGADLRNLRDGAGMKAMVRASELDAAHDAWVVREDFVAVLAERGITPKAKRAAGAKKRTAGAAKKQPAKRPSKPRQLG